MKFGCGMQKLQYRPVASIAFHAKGEVLAVVSGHKLYIWHYNRRGEGSSPTIVLKTRRSLRAVHFHPHAAPFLLTAEVNDLDSSDSSMTRATSPVNELPMSLPFLIRPSIQHRADTSSSVRLLTYSTPSSQYEVLLSPVEQSESLVHTGSSVSANENTATQPLADAMENDGQPEERNNQFFPFSDPAYWELPFLQGWLIGQSQAGQQAAHSELSGSIINPSPYTEQENPSSVPLAIPSNSHPRAEGSGSRYRSSRSRAIPVVGANPLSAVHDGSNSQISIGRIQTEIASSLAAAVAAELPCTMKLRVWTHDVKVPCAPLDAERCRLTIQHAVLCSKMGAHFSPCGNF